MTPRRTPEDSARWTEFATAAEAAANTPAQSPVKLAKACVRAARAVLPCEPYTAANPWVSALHVAQRFCGEMAPTRADMAGDLAARLAAAQAHCRIFTGGGIPAGPASSGEALPTRAGLPFRADLDG